MRPVVSTPTACRGLFADGEILTNFHAGGMTSDLIRSSDSSFFISAPLASKYLKPFDLDPFRFHHFALRPFSTTARIRARGVVMRSIFNCPSMLVRVSITNCSVFKETNPYRAGNYCHHRI